MAREFSRTQRVADFIKRELAGQIQFELRDPRIGMVSITDVEVSRDLGHARIFVTVLGTESKDEAQESIAALNNAAGFLRSQLARVNQSRTTPSLKFFYDESVIRGQKLSRLIDEAVSSDKRELPESAED